MNRIYKIIYKAFSGEGVVVSELASSRGKGRGCLRAQANRTGTGRRGVLFRAATALLLAACSSGAIAQQQVYDNSSAGMLELPGSVGSGLPAWMGIVPTDQGLVYRSSGSIVATGADLLIDYSTAPAPKFVTGGYSDTGVLVENNTVTLRNGLVDGPVYGGLSHNTLVTADMDKSGYPPAQDNSANTNVSLTSKSASAAGNIVNVGNGVTVTGDVYGGNATIWAQSGQARAGDVDTAVGPTSPNVSASALSEVSSVVTTVTANDNILTVGDGSTVMGNIHGGYANAVAQAANATGGHVDITDTATVVANATANTAATITYSTAAASDNKVIVGNNALISGNIHGGYANVFAQTGYVTTDNADVAGTTPSAALSVYTNASASATAFMSNVMASDNAVMVGNHTSVTGNIHGGYASMLAQTAHATAGDATATSINPAAVTATAVVFTTADVSDSTVTASDNIVTVGNRTSVTGNIHGGYASVLAQTAHATAGDATTTNTASGFAGAAATASIEASYSTMTSSGNIVMVGEGTSVSGNIYGGSASLVLQAGNSTGGDAVATDNSYAIAYATSYTTASGSTVMASDNKVTVGNGSIAGGDISGGFAALTVNGGTAIAGMDNGNLSFATASVDVSASQVLANNNTLNVKGTLQGGSIYGGYTQFDVTQGTISGNSFSSNTVSLTGSLAQATNNTVTLGINAQVSSPSGSLYGGYLAYNAGYAPASYDVFSGNTLTYLAKLPSVVQKVGNFEKYNFALTPAYANANTALISVHDIELGAMPSNISDGSTTASTVSVTGIHSGKILQAEDKFILMSADNSMTGHGSGSTATGISQAQQGISLLYDVQTDVDMAGKTITATILGCQTATGDVCPVARVNPQLKALSEGYLAGSQLVMRGGDLIADDAFKAINSQNNKKGYAPFAILSGQHNRYNSGSHITSNDFLMTGGLSYQKEGVTAGAFVEAGWGSYDTYNSFVDAASVKGDGNGRYYGLGLLGRYDFINGFYTDASLRFGQHRNKFDTGDIRNATTAESARYNLKSNYVSAHIGGGYLLQIDGKNQLDMSGKYLWTRLGGKEALIAEDNIRFDRINSQRLRVNGEWSHHYSNTVTLKAGLGYEHEFDSKAKATTYDTYNIDTVNVKGGTGILSWGARVRPTENENLTLDLTASGYVGKREGASASVKMNYAF